MRKILIGAGIVLSILLVYYRYHPLGQKVIINGHTIAAEVAITNAEKQKGLGGRTTLGKDQGMLFVYQHADRYGYWMKDMQFPLDFIWIHGTTVVDLSKRIPAPDASSPRPVEIAPIVPV